MVSVVSLFFVAGCATNKEIYYWGEYEQLIHDAYVLPGSADPQTQIEKLNTDLQKTEELGKKPAPGIYAHLGFLYAIEGRQSESKTALMEERLLYPESEIFIDGMMSRSLKNKRGY